MGIMSNLNIDYENKKDEIRDLPDKVLTGMYISYYQKWNDHLLDKDEEEEINNWSRNAKIRGILYFYMKEQKYFGVRL